MFPEIAGELGTGAVFLAAAVLLGRWLYGLSRRNPTSNLINGSMIADFVCVTEVMLLGIGVMLLLRALFDIF